MSVRVRRKGDKVTVETDYAGSGVDHSMVHSNRGLTGAMKSFGINEVKGSKRAGATYSLEKDFDNKIKKKYGRDQGYFSPL